MSKPRWQRYFLFFSSRRFIVQILYFRSFICFEFTFVYGTRCRSKYLFLLISPFGCNLSCHWLKLKGCLLFTSEFWWYMFVGLTQQFHQGSWSSPSIHSATLSMLTHSCKRVCWYVASWLQDGCLYSKPYVLTQLCLKKMKEVE